MKKRRLMPRFVSTTLLAVLGFGTLLPASAQTTTAQTTTASATTGKKTRGSKRAGNKGLPKRMVAKLEEKTGKPLTDDQKARLGAAYKARTAAVKAAQEKFNQDAATITGLSLEDIQGLNKRGKTAKGAMAPTTAPAMR